MIIISFDSMLIRPGSSHPVSLIVGLIQCMQKFIESIRSCHGSVNTLNLGGDSILHSIVKRQYANHRKKMELKLKYLNGLLMYSDIDVNLPNEQKATALHIAVEVSK